MRTFETGATRNDDEGKIDYLGHLSHRAVQRFGAYMHAHRRQADGSLRAADNFKAGIPIPSYMTSGYRHMQDLARHYEATGAVDQDLVCAVWFNLQGLLHEALRPETAPEAPTGATTLETIEADTTALDAPKDRNGVPLRVGDKVDWYGVSQVVVSIYDITHVRIGDWPGGGYSIDARACDVVKEVR